MFSISPLDVDMPQGCTPICTDSALLAAANTAGMQATNRVLARVLESWETEEEVSYYIDTMCDRSFL